MLIFTLPSWYKTKTHPENSIFIYEQMQAIQKLGHKIVVLSVQPVAIQSLRKVNKSICRIVDNGIITYYTEIQVVQPSRFRGLYVHEFEMALKKLVDRAITDIGKPDVFYAHFSFAAGFSATKLNYDIPLVVEEHYSGLMEKPDKKLVSILKRTVESSNRFICVSPGLRNAVIKLTGEHSNICVVSNMINPCFCYQELNPNNEFIFLGIGSLIKRKGFELLIRAFAEEFYGEEHIKLRIGGSGEKELNLRKLINSLNVEKKVCLLGQLSRKETLIEYANCNCFVLPSRAETYGLVYREAMAVGRPIISTRHGGFDDSLPETVGELIDVDNIEQLKSAMRKVYLNFKSYNLQDISEYALQECSAENVSKKITETLQNALEDGKKRNNQEGKRW